MSSVIITPQLNKEIAVVKKETAPVLSMATKLAVSDPQSYAVADSLLTKIVDARKAIKARLARFMDPLKQAVDSAKEAYKEAQSFHAEVDNPLLEAEGTVRQKMKGYKLEEAKQAQLAERKRQEEAEELRQQAFAKSLAESRAKTQAMKERLAEQRRELEEKSIVAEAAPAPQVARAAGSTARTVKVPKVTDAYAFLTALSEARSFESAPAIGDSIPLSTVDINLTAIKAFYKSNPEWVKQWPGIEIVDDIQIVHR